MTCAKNASTWIHAAAATWRNAGRPRRRAPTLRSYARRSVAVRHRRAHSCGCPIAERPLPGREGPRPSAVSSYSTRGGTVGNTFLVQKPSRSRMRSVVVSVFCGMLLIALRREAADFGRYRRLEPRHPSARPAATDICGDRRHGRCVPRTPPLLSHVLCPPFPAALEKSYRAIIQLQCGGSDASSECSRCRGNRCPGVLAGLAVPARGQAPAIGVTVFEGAQLIVGNESAPIENATLVVDGARLVQAGRAADVRVPAGGA